MISDPKRKRCGGVLIVEDDEGIRSALALALMEEGYVATTAEHGQEALDLLETADPLPCVILLDMMMPVLDGRGFLETRADVPLIADIPVVVVTADRRALREAADLRAQEVLLKPISLEELLASVGQYCERHFLPGVEM